MAIHETYFLCFGKFSSNERGVDKRMGKSGVLLFKGQVMAFELKSNQSINTDHGMWKHWARQGIPEKREIL